MGLAVFNTRGHDTVTRLDRAGRSKKHAGAAFERFAECVHDIRAVVDLLRREGFRRIILVGHSTGANKAVYYLHKTGDRRVEGVGLLGSVSDVIGEQCARGRAYAPLLRAAARQVAQGRGDALFVPGKIGALWSAQRYLSLFRSGSAEDVFPYGNPQGSWRALESVRVPILAMLGENDEYLDRPAADVLRALHDHATRAPRFRGIVIRNASHSFRGHEQEMAEAIREWIVEDCTVKSL